MRKVLVFGAAIAASCVSAVTFSAAGQASAGAVHAGAHNPSPGPTGTGDPLTGSPSPGQSGPGGQNGQNGQGGTITPQPSPGAPANETEAVSSAQGVMVTPPAPKSDTYAYGRDPRQRVDAYWRPPRPAKKGTKPTPGPGILLLHGGYWTGGDKAGWKYPAWRLSNRGYAVFAANYRLAGDARWPAQRNDANAALAFIKRHARTWNLDPNRIVVVGSSAGGQLATMLGTYGAGSSQVKGVVALSPPNSPYLAFVDGGKAAATVNQVRLREAVRRLVGCTPSEVDPTCWTRVDDATSANHAGVGDAPMLLMHGGDDFVPVTHSAALASALRRVGVPAKVETVPGASHGPTLLLNENAYQRMVSWIHERVAAGAP